MKSAFVQTTNVRRYLQALSALEDRGASEACFIVIDGEPGLGKTTTLRMGGQRQHLPSCQEGMDAELVS